MARHRIKKYSRRTRSQYSKSRVPIILSVIAFLLLSLIISVFVGISLGKRAEESKPEPRFDLPVTQYISNGKSVTGVEAYHFSKSSDAGSYIAQGIYDLSVCIRHKDGTLDYDMPIAEKYPLFGENGQRSLTSLCTEAHEAGGRVCAYIYISSFSVSDTYERDIMKSYELALINEAALSGVDDILLLGLSPTEENIEELEEFTAHAAIAAGKAPLGAAVAKEVFAMSEQEVYIASRLKNACDYLALDLTELTVEDGESGMLSEELEENEFYIRSYPLRILFSQGESKLYIPALELGVTDLQIVGE